MPTGLTPKQQAIQEAVAAIRTIVKDLDVADAVLAQCDLIDQNAWGVTLGDVVMGTQPAEPDVVALDAPVPESLVPIPEEAPLTGVRLPVISGFLAAIGYDQTTKRLEVEFQTGHEFLIRNVELDEYHEFMAQGANMGSYFNRRLRPRMVEMK